jgi:hypothetical protein
MAFALCLVTRKAPMMGGEKKIQVASHGGVVLI